MTAAPPLACFLVGDVQREAGARTKYGLLFEALGRLCQVQGIHDLTLRGPDRWVNLAQTFHPRPRTWKERFYKNLPAFRRRSQLAARLVRQNYAALPGGPLLFQVGVLFDARWENPPLPSVIYTDYTARLSQRKPGLSQRKPGLSQRKAGSERFPFAAQQGEQWIALEKQAFERASLVFTRGQFVRASIIEDYGLPPQRVIAVGGGVNFALPILEQALPQASDRPGPVILFIGKEFQRKGGDLLLQAFAQVRQAYPQARLTLLTEGQPTLPPSLQPPSPAAFDADLLQQGIHLVAPTWDRLAIAALYQQADIFVLPSREETWGDVLLEAMAYGLPCVGVTGDAMSEIILHDITGLVVPADPIALAGALQQLLSDPARRVQMGQAARQRVEAEYTWDGVVQKMLPHLQHLAITKATL